MTLDSESWIERIVAANTAFVDTVDVDRLPIERRPGAAVITCMDPRVNLAAIGIPAFDRDGHGTSTTRIIRTIGSGAEDRSLVVGIFLAGIREIAVMMHTDCGACLAHDRIDLIADRMEQRLSSRQLAEAERTIGSPLGAGLRAYLGTFSDPRHAVAQRVASIRSSPFVPHDVVVHGLIYSLETGAVQVFIDGRV